MMIQFGSQHASNGKVGLRARQHPEQAVNKVLSKVWLWRPSFPSDVGSSFPHIRLVVRSGVISLELIP